jgi:NAD-dependent dihydropyrimidine dehydrogenase PreA subunit
MAVRKVIRIDEEKCDGCGDCVTSCAEGAIAIIDGKARLVSEVYCDGLGACLGHCPQGAITIEEREAADFDEVKTQQHLSRLRQPRIGASEIPLTASVHQCPGSMTRSLGNRLRAPAMRDGAPAGLNISELMNWPIQMALVSPVAPYFKDADILLVADCVPFACADFHQRFLQGKPVIIGCPKLDQTDAYVRKLAQILHLARPRSLTVVHMEVPCCSGLTRIAEHARAAAESDLPLKDVTVSIRGEVLAAA